ncbi:MAG: mandelate racemase/muconate lactonizing enzyme family protein [Bryobacteraceae bacterium]
MRIQRVQSYLMSYALPEPLTLKFFGGERTILKRDAMLIRVDLENGLTGWAPGPGSERAHHVIQNFVGPFLEGRMLADIDALRVQFFGTPAGAPEHRNPYCAVEVALYDVLGKAHGFAMSEILGGRVRDRIRLYSSAGMYQPPQSYADEAARFSELGFSAYKFRPALGPQGDLDTVERMRANVPNGFELMVDAHSWWRMGDRSYNRETIHRLARQFAESEIYWLEEPFPPDDHAAYQALRDLEYVPIATGEHEPDENGYLDLIRSRASDYIQMDVCCQGGFTMGRRIFSEIGRAGLKFAFHSWGTALEVLAAAHLGVCWPESVVEWLEYPIYTTSRVQSMYPFPLAAEILAEPLEIRQGELIVPSAPGLGIAINEKVIERYPWLPGPWSIFRLESPPETYAITSDHSVKWADGENSAGHAGNTNA